MKAIGKIAQLPAKVREALNRRLHDGQPASVILPWLNALPEVIDVLKDRFDAEPVSEQNLSLWRNGGFQRWLAERDEIEGMRDLAMLSQEIADAAGLSVIDGTASVAAGLVLKTLRQIHQTIEKPAEAAEPGEASDAEAVALNPKLLDGIAKLQAAATMRKKLHLDERKVDQKDRALELAEAQFELRYVAAFIEHAGNKRAHDIATGAAPKEVKMEQLRLLLFGTKPAEPAPAVA